MVSSNWLNAELPVQKKLFAPVYSDWRSLLHIKLPLIYLWHRIISIIRTISMLSMFASNSICNSKSLEVNIIVCEKSSIHVSPCRVCMTYICKWKVYCSLVPEKCLGTKTRLLKGAWCVNAWMALVLVGRCMVKGVYGFFYTPVDIRKAKRRPFWSQAAGYGPLSILQPKKSAIT